MNRYLILFVIVTIGFVLVKKSESFKNDSPRMSPSSRVEILSNAGEMVTLAPHCVRGGITLFDFYADWCGPCRALAEELEPYVNSRPGVYMKKINIKDWDSPVAGGYQINSIPSIWIFDQNGREICTRLNRLDKIKEVIENLHPGQTKIPSEPQVHPKPEIPSKTEPAPKPSETPAPSPESKREKPVVKIYKWTDEQGRNHLSNIKPTGVTTYEEKTLNN